MAKFKEYELPQILENFKATKQIELELDKSIEGTIKLQNAKIEYDEKYGFIYITNNICNFKINTTLVYSYEKNENEIIIDLDTIILKIKK